MIEELFKKLVKQTTPNGFEFLVYDCIPNAIIDDFGNRYVIVGDGPHKHLFTCHLFGWVMPGLQYLSQSLDSFVIRS